MGFGGMGMPVLWLFGVVVLAAIWAGVWWMLVAIGLTPGRHPHQLPPPSLRQRPESQTWQQPGFAAGDCAAPSMDAVPDPRAHIIHTESDDR
ncbi:hypothetical protein PROP_02248 [Propionicimonas sp. T2.31MG-18]